jgi:hypothetical protein
MNTITRYYGSGSSTPNLCWVRLDGRNAISLDYNRPEAELIAQAETYWRNQDAWQVVENQLRSHYPDTQIYQGPLPTRDVEWNGPEGQYLYCLKNRKAHGKFQILCAMQP